MDGRLASISQEYCSTLFLHGRHGQAIEASERGQGRALLDLMFRHQIKLQGGRTIRVAGNGRVILDAPSLSEINTVLRAADIHLFKLLETGGRTLAWFASPDGSMHAWEVDTALSVLERLIGLLLPSGKSGLKEAKSNVTEVRAYQPAKHVSWERGQESAIHALRGFVSSACP